MRDRSLLLTLTGLTIGLSISVTATDRAHALPSAKEVRDIFAAGLSGIICQNTGAYAGYCAALGIAAASWIDEGVSLVIDRHFRAEDQRFADEHGITICYSDGTCIAPKPKP